MKRRDFAKGMAGAMLGLMLPRGKARAVPAAGGLSDPELQPKFVNLVPDALAPGFKFDLRSNKGRAASVKVGMGPSIQQTGLIGPGGLPVSTPVFGYGSPSLGYTWPGRTFEVQSGQPITVRWENKLLDPLTGLPLNHLLPVDTSLHWAYSLTGYNNFSIPVNGVPLVPHLHGGHTTAIFDGNPEYFFSPGFGVRGPRWVEKDYVYDNDQPAGNLWYHDHALGITRLNVYAGLAGFYFIRDTVDTGMPNNPLGLPAWPYEKAYAIQDRMFWATGELFYPAYPGDPFYDDFITGQATLPATQFPGGGPTALAEFFGDHMVVNGVIWPFEAVEPRKYRMHLLNGTDSRFMVIRFRVAATPTSTDLVGASDPLPFTVIGSDQGLGNAQQMDLLVFEPGGRYDIVVDFSQVPAGSRVIMENLGGDAPFGGEWGDSADWFPYRQTDRIMAFDVVLPYDNTVPAAGNPLDVQAYAGNGNTHTNTRRVALFEGTDEYGRLQPLLGTAEPTVDAMGNVVNGSIPWHMPTTENPALGSTEIWEIYNKTMDGHPVHLHLVHFEVLSRQAFTAALTDVPIMQHGGALGTGAAMSNIQLVGGAMPTPPGYFEGAPKDMVTALPGQVTRIKATFDKPGRYVWHCHILSHEDHEMMRVLHVGPGA